MPAWYPHRAVPQIHYLIENRSVDVEPGETILQTSLGAGIPHAHACGGHARCSTCRVYIAAGLPSCSPRNDKEAELASRLRFLPEVRLACQTRIHGDVTLRRLVLDQTDIALTDQQQRSAVPTPIGEERTLAIMFADIRGFTPFAERLLPFDVVHALNRYYDEVGRVIDAHGGRIDNYMGDGLLALFGLSGAHETARRAVAAALDMIAAVDRLVPYLETVYGDSFRIGIGIHWGSVVVGAIGAAGQQRVTVVGDAVNIAARIESATKILHVPLLVSDDLMIELRGAVRAGPAHRVALPGKSGEYLLHEVAAVV